MSTVKEKIANKTPNHNSVVDILETSKYVQRPKAEENKIVLDGVLYDVTFNIRDKGKQQIQYLIEFKESETPGQSTTATKGLLPSDQASHNNSIAQKTKKSTPKSKHSVESSSEDGEEAGEGASVA